MAAEYPISKIFDPTVFRDYEAIIRSQRELTAELIHFNEVAKGFQQPGGLKDFTETSKQAETATKKLDSTIKELNATGARRAAIEKEFNDAMQLHVKTINDAVRQNKALKDARDMVNASTEKGKKTIKEYNDIIDKNTKFIKENSDADKQRTSGIGKYYDAILKATAAVSAFLISGRLVINFFKESITLAMEEERTQARLNFVLNGQADAVKRMNSFIQFSYRNTMFKKDDIQAAVAFSLELGKTEAETRKLINAAMGLSRVTGQDLDGAMKMLIGTYNGVTRGINRYVEGVAGLTKEQYAAGVAIDMVNDKLGKLATEGIGTTQGQIKQASDAWREFKESVGNFVLPILGQQITTFSATVFRQTEARLADARNYLKSLQDNKGPETLIKSAEAEVASFEHAMRLAQNLDKMLADSAERDRKNKEAAARTKEWTIKPPTDEEIKKQEEAAKKAEEALKRRIELEKQLAEALNKTGLRPLSEQMAAEIEIEKKKDYYLIASEEQRQQLILGIKKKYGDEILKIIQKQVDDQIKEEKRLADLIVEEKKEEKERLKKEEEAGYESTKFIIGRGVDRTLHELERERDTAILLRKEEINTINELSSALNEVGNAMLASDDKNMAKYEANIETRKNDLENLYTKGLMDQRTYNQKSKDLDNELTAKKRENAKKEADIILAMALVTTAAKLAQSLATGISAATTAAESGGPAAPILEGIYIAQMVLEILGGFAAVYSAIQSAQSASYEKGTHDAPEGFATVHPGEGIERNGTITPTPERPALTFLKKHDKVYTRQEMQAMTASGLLNTDYRSSTTAKENDLSGFMYLGEIIKNKPETQFALSNGELIKIVKIGQSKFEYRLRNTVQ